MEVTESRRVIYKDVIGANRAELGWTRGNCWASRFEQGNSGSVGTVRVRGPDTTELLLQIRFP